MANFYTRFLLLAALLNGAGRAAAQTPGVGIGTTAPNPAALLDLNSTTKGLLPPRLNQTQRTTLTTSQNLGVAQAGLLIFNTSTRRLNLWDGTAWTEAVATPNTTNTSPAAQAFTYTGAPQTYRVPAGITSIQVVAIGARGGDFFGTPGGQGARVGATLSVTPGEMLTICVGGPGTDNAGGAGGYNGGGNGTDAASGGGATDLRRGSATLADRLLVAGGGGGAGGANWVGGASGQTGQDGGGSDAVRGRGATQTAGGAGGNDGSGANGEDGALGQGGAGFAGAFSAGGPGGGGGGGGYYGGGGGVRRYTVFPGGTNTIVGAGGGGSSYASPGATGVSYQTTNSASSLTITPVGTLASAPVLDGSNITGVPGTYDNLGNHAATQDLNLNGHALNFGTTTDQLINLYSTHYGIGIQNNTQYFRSSDDFAWFRGGAHSSTRSDAGPGGTVHMLLSSSGNLGVGVAAPLARLHVNGNARLQNGAAVNEFSTDGTLADNSDLALPTEKAVKTYVDSNFGSHRASQNVQLNGNWLSNDGGNEGLRVDNSGNVGVGTAAPAARLDVAGGEVRLPGGGSGITHFNYSDGKNYLRGSTVIGDQNGNTVQIGQGGTPLNQILRASFTGQPVVTVPGTGYVELTFTVAGARLGATVFASTDAGLTRGIVVANAYVSAANQVKVRLANYRTGGLDSGATDFYISLIQ